MGAPTGHPFFGNQYTNGGYIIGSFTYPNLVEPAVDAAKNALAPLVVKVTNGGKPSALAGSLVAAGVAVVLTGGVLAYAYMQNKANKQVLGAVESDDIANFGTCESCGEALGESGPMTVQSDGDGSFVICEHCTHKNYAKYPEIGDEPQWTEKN